MRNTSKARRRSIRRCGTASVILAMVIPMVATPSAHASPPPGEAAAYREALRDRHAHAALHGRLPRLYPQETIQSGRTIYGSCRLVGGGAVSCDTSRRLRELRLPASFAVDDRYRVVRVNAAAYEAFRQVVDHIDAEGYGRLIKQFETTVERQCRFWLGGGWIDNCISNHSWGNAVDINNVDRGRKDFEKLIAPVAAIFESHNFVWGKYFNGNYDPPHFQYASK